MVLEQHSIALLVVSAFLEQKKDYAPAGGEIVGILENRRNALFYQSNDPASVSKCLDLLVESKRLRQKLAQNAYFDFQQKYSWKARINLLINEVEKNIA